MEPPVDAEWFKPRRKDVAALKQRCAVAEYREDKAVRERHEAQAQAADFQRSRDTAERLQSQFHAEANFWARQARDAEAAKELAELRELQATAALEEERERRIAAESRAGQAELNLNEEVAAKERLEARAFVFGPFAPRAHATCRRPELRSEHSVRHGFWALWNRAPEASLAEMHPEAHPEAASSGNPASSFAAPVPPGQPLSKRGKKHLRAAARKAEWAAEHDS